MQIAFPDGVAHRGVHCIGIQVVEEKPFGHIGRYADVGGRLRGGSCRMLHSLSLACAVGLPYPQFGLQSTLGLAQLQIARSLVQASRNRLVKLFLAHIQYFLEVLGLQDEECQKRHAHDDSYNPNG